MKKIHDIKEISFDRQYMNITVDGKKHMIDLNNQSKRLANSSENVKKNYIISSSGYGIHWPDIDEDLSIDGLLGIKHKIEKKKIAVNA